jgi:predicted hydrocarbon binding protein
MMGFTHLGLKAFVEKKLGAAAWHDISASRGLSIPYLAHNKYLDKEMETVVTAIADRSRTSVAAVLREIGEFLAPAFIQMSSSMISSEWRTIDLPENIEEKIHVPLRRQMPDAKPPVLRIRRVSPEEVRILYGSSHRLCPFTEGLIKGIANHYRETVSIEQPSCMFRGDTVCELRVVLGQ